MLLCIHTKKLHMNEKIPLYVFIAYFGHFRSGNFHFALCAFVLHSIDIVLRLPIVFEKHNKLLNMHIQYRTNAILNISPFFFIHSFIALCIDPFNAPLILVGFKIHHVSCVEYRNSMKPINLFH